MPTVLAVDGNSVAHRAYHAIVRDEPEGDHWLTGGVVRMLATAWTQGPYDGVVIGFDGPDNRRRQLFEGYKANRPDKDPELVEQLARLPDHLDACGFTVSKHDGIEADDVLAAAAEACSARGWHCDVLSSDRDLMALVSDLVRVLRPRATMSDLKAYGPAAVEAEFGVRPDQYTDYAALRGDPSDGLPGVRGVGKKTARRLLRDHGDVPGIYRSLSHVTPRVEALLRDGREIVERNLLLMAPLPNVEVDVDGAVERGVDPDRVVEALTPLGLGRSAGIFRHAVTRPPLPPMPPPPVDVADTPPPPAAAPGGSGSDPIDDHAPTEADPDLVITLRDEPLPEHTEQPSLF
ncbi:MAG: 5'-3' exonuclease H3TH domain-containing protein [Nitriliruptorales bacterium]|nr:5'-3' exonuclease H3TH domain-containing protein [Nitriliruptorales bacterium]